VSDLPPYLSHTKGRNIPWAGHSVFPRKVFTHKAVREAKIRGWRPDYVAYQDLRIFKLSLKSQAYVLMTEEEIQRYMEDPTRV